MGPNHITAIAHHDKEVQRRPALGGGGRIQVEDVRLVLRVVWARSRYEGVGVYLGRQQVEPHGQGDRFTLGWFQLGIGYSHFFNVWSKSNRELHIFSLSVSGNDLSLAP